MVTGGFYGYRCCWRDDGGWMMLLISGKMINQLICGMSMALRAELRDLENWMEPGTQGYDSLSDDAYIGSSEKPKENSGDNESHTGSSSEDFDDKED
jgi:hypothetical protein